MLVALLTLPAVSPTGFPFACSGLWRIFRIALQDSRFAFHTSRIATYAQVQRWRHSRTGVFLITEITVCWSFLDCRLVWRYCACCRCSSVKWGKYVPTTAPAAPDPYHTILFPTRQSSIPIERCSSLVGTQSSSFFHILERHVWIRFFPLFQVFERHSITSNKDGRFKIISMVNLGNKLGRFLLTCMVIDEFFSRKCDSRKSHLKPDPEIWWDELNVMHSGRDHI